MRSHKVTRGLERAPHRSLFWAAGFHPEELSRTGMGLDESVALITGGRFSGATRGGAIALIEEGDPVRIDIPGRRLELPVAEAVLARRRAAWQRPCPKIEHGYLRRYAAQVTSAGRGAVLVPGGEAGGGE